MASINNFKVKHGLVVSTTATVLSSDQATSTTTGALQVVGGVGIGRNLYVGGTTFLAGDLYVDGTQFSVNSTNIVTGDRAIYLSTSSNTAIAATDSGIAIGPLGATYASFLFDGVASFKSAASIIPSTSTFSIGSTEAQWSKIYAKNAVISSLSGYITANNTGLLTSSATIPGSDILGTVSSAKNIIDGAAGSLLYQSAPGTTTFLDIGAQDTVLLSNGESLYWALAAGLTASATNSENIFVNEVTTATNYYLGLTTVIGDNSPVASDATLTYDTTNHTLTAGNLAAANVVVSGAIVHDQTAVAVGTTAVTVDTFPVAKYRSAKYVISITNTGRGEFQTSEVLLVHSNTDSFLTDSSVFSGSRPLMEFTTMVSGGAVLVKGIGTNAGNTVKVQKIYITI